ncbi:hypothetical protein CSPX01_09403 [Colletotrichum filicis]|nr:hypothetical protein CSPX01_09403 [Colletotrichum filicis]
MLTSYNVLRLIPAALAAPPIIDPFLEVCGVSITLSIATNTLLLPPQTISLYENSNCAIPPITARGSFPPTSTQHYKVPNTQLPQETISQASGGSSPTGDPDGQPATTQLGSSPPSAQPPASNAPRDPSSAASSAGGSGGNSPTATASSSSKPPAVSTSSASRSFSTQ